LTQVQKEEKRRELNILRDQVEVKLLGGYELLYPLPESPENEDRIREYAMYLE